MIPSSPPAGKRMSLDNVYSFHCLLNKTICWTLWHFYIKPGGGELHLWKIKIRGNMFHQYCFIGLLDSRINYIYMSMRHISEVIAGSRTLSSLLWIFSKKYRQVKPHLLYCFTNYLEPKARKENYSQTFVTVRKLRCKEHHFNTCNAIDMTISGSIWPQFGTQVCNRRSVDTAEIGTRVQQRCEISPVAGQINGALIGLLSHLAILLSRRVLVESLPWCSSPPR